MTVYANVADEREVGTYSAYVDQIRGNDGKYPDDQIISFMRISPKTLEYIRLVINQHPDWDDDDVAEEVLNMEDADEE